METDVNNDTTIPSGAMRDQSNHRNNRTNNISLLPS